MDPLFCPVYVLDRRMQEGKSPPKWTKRTTQKVYVGHLHHCSKSLPMVWDPKTKLVSPQFHVMFDDNFNTVQAPYPNIKQADTMDRLFKTNIYTYYDPFGEEHTYLFSHGGTDIHPNNLTPTIETCHAAFTMTPCSDTQQNNSTENNPNNKSILSMQDIVMLHANNIYPQSIRDDVKAYKHLHRIDMQIHSIPKSPKQKAQEMELSDLHHEELKIFVLRLCVNGSRQIQSIDYTESFAPMVQWSMICMVNTLAAMHNLKGKQIDFTQAFPQAKLKEDIYLQFPAGFEHKKRKMGIKTQTKLIRPRSRFTKLVSQTQRHL
jgi:hypothetical protein